MKTIEWKSIFRPFIIEEGRIVTRPHIIRLPLKSGEPVTAKYLAEQITGKLIYEDKYHDRAFNNPSGYIVKEISDKKLNEQIENEKLAIGVQEVKGHWFTIFKLFVATERKTKNIVLVVEPSQGFPMTDFTTDKKRFSEISKKLRDAIQDTLDEINKLIQEEKIEKWNRYSHL